MNPELAQIETALRRAFVGLPSGIFRTRTRQRSIVWPRQIGMAALVDQFGLTYSHAGRVTGKDHGTIRHALVRVRDAAQVDNQAQAEIQRFLRALGEVRR